MENIEQQRFIQSNNVFDSRFLDAKALYLYYFNELPNLYFRNKIDSEKVFEAFKEKFGTLIIQTLQHRWYKSKKKHFQFYATYVILDNHCLVEFCDNYCRIMHNDRQSEFIEEMMKLGNQFKEKQRRRLQEINLVVRSSSGLTLTEMEIKRVKLNLGLFYEDDFQETHELIRKRLSRKKDKGIVLLHGLPGTGKTTYLRHLIGSIKKRILFLSPAVAAELLNPDFVSLLIENPNTVLIIEDAENIIMDRKLNTGSAVSNLLNLSDGLLADCLNVQIICTFNSPLTMIDTALLRKGRLIAKYEFGKLGVRKSQLLSNYLGFNTTISQPMSIAEIAGQHEKTQKTNSVETIGFRREYLIN